MTGVGESTVICIVNEVSQAIVENLWTKFVSNLFPKNQGDFSNMMGEMDSEWQFPFAFSAIDGSHLPMKCPPGGPEAMKQYHNFKNFYSIILLALVDPKYRFIWASVGAPGNTHDSTLFQSTSLWEKITAGSILPQSVLEIEDQAIPPLILGDGAFPMRTWIIKPYGDAILNEQKRYLNYRLSRARMVTEGAFGKLKGRWRVLSKKCESNPETLKRFGLASIVLHNICIEMGDIIPRNIDLTIDPSSNKRRPRNELREVLQMTDINQRHLGTNSAEAKSIRDFLAEIFWEERQSYEEQ